jgi:hypothetical protein
VEDFMTDLKKMKEIFDSQLLTDWPKINYNETKDKERITLRVEMEQIGFVFSLRGRFIGVYNWKAIVTHNVRMIRKPTGLMWTRQRTLRPRSGRLYCPDRQLR